MSAPIRILFVEDNAVDAELEIHQLKRHGLEVETRLADSRESLERELALFDPELVISDHSLPGFDGLSALAAVAEARPDLPFIFVSGTLGEDHAIESLRLGATDYVLKTNLARLGPAVERALEGAKVKAERRRYQEELKNTKERLDSILSSLWDTVWSLSPEDHSVLYLNAAVVDIANLPRSAFLRDPQLWPRLVHPEDRPRVEEAWEAMLSRNVPFNTEYRIIRPDGEIRWVHDQGRLVRDEQNRPLRVDGIARDITSRHQQEEKIARLSRIQAMLGGINSAIVRSREAQELLEEACRISVDAGGFPTAWIGLLAEEGKVLQWVASAGEPLFDPKRDKVPVQGPGSRGENLSSQVIQTGLPAVCNDLANDNRPIFRRASLLKAGLRSFVLLPLRTQGGVVGLLGLLSRTPDTFDEEELTLLSGLAADISFAMESLEKEERLRYLSYYDVLTGLPNRDLFQDRLNQLLHTARVEGRGLALAMVDLDHFTRINETLGRQSGDTLLREVAHRLGSALEELHGLARLGPDHFGIILPGTHAAAEVARMVEERVLSQLTAPFILDRSELRIAARAGVALFPGDGGDAEALLHNAEAALKNAKQSGDRCLFYAPRMNAQVAETLRLENRLRHAVEEGHFVLHYQPKATLSTRRLVGVEALLRWQDPEQGLIPPLKFIPLLEETGLILDVGRWILEKARDDHRAWREAGLQAPRIAVNISPLQLRQATFVATVLAAVEAGPDCGIDLEITESMLMDDIEGSIAKLQAVRDEGLGIAIDDFGTGYSSLNYLARLPVDCLKIDRAFVTRMSDRRDDHAIVASVISLAHALGRKVVAEGVETEEQARLLDLMGCDQMQGYLFSKPVPAEQLIGLLSLGE
ncbi:MAG TPA: EAL domain-containing protein [Holophagaceae bacterium]|nr:EAL domain-containing protein [Holophagaceae bacterium]